MEKEFISTRKAIAAALITHIFWGLSFMASRKALNTAPVIILLSHRFLLEALKLHESEGVFHEHCLLLQCLLP